MERSQPQASSKPKYEMDEIWFHRVKTMYKYLRFYRKNTRQKKKHFATIRIVQSSF